MSFLGSLLGLAPAPVTTEAVLSQADIQALLPSVKINFGKTNYAQVRDDYILGLLDRAHTALSKFGLSQWQPDATCTLFAYNALVCFCEEYFQSMFHTANPPPSGAAGFVWFVPDGGTTGHAINVFFTPSGAVFADPQVPGQLRPMLPSEIASIYNCDLP